MTIDELELKRQEHRDAAVAIVDEAAAANEGEGRNLTEDEQKSYDAHFEDVKALDVRIENERKREELTRTEGRQVTPPLAGSEKTTQPATPTRATAAATPRRWAGTLKHFRNRPDRVYKHRPEERAFRFMKALRAKAGIGEEREWCDRNNIEWRVLTEKVNYQGGYLVPESVDGDLIDNIEDYGVARADCRRIVMDSDMTWRPRVNTRHTIYVVGENAAGTESTAAFDRVNLTARKVMGLTTMSSELSKDAMISMADWIIGDMARQFAAFEDDALFNGTGTSSYAGIKGLINTGSAGTKTMTAGDDTAAEFLLADIVAGMALLPEWADTQNTKWYMSKFFYHAAFDRLAAAAGGNTRMMLMGEKWIPQFLGYPVVFSSKMPTSDVASQIFAYFGDLGLAADFGDRRMVSVAISDNAYVGSTSMFEADSLAIKATERFDINCHDIGDSSNAGAVIAFKSGTA